MKVLLADDHKLVRAGIRRLLEELPEIVVVGEADDGIQACELARNTLPDIVVSDISMPRMTGLELTAWLAANLPHIRVIVLSMHTAREYVIEALGVGARGYVLKHAASEEIEQAIRAVASDNVYLSPEVSRHMADALLRKPAEQGSSGRAITSRQREVLKLVAAGRSSKQIAGLLGISPRTVETHRAELMDRLGANDAIGLLREAARLGLVDLDAEE